MKGLPLSPEVPDPFGILSARRNSWQNSLPAVFVGVANPVEPFRFKIVQGVPRLTMLGEIRDGLGQPPNWFGQLADGQANLLDKIHTGFLAPAVRRLNCRYIFCTNASARNPLGPTHGSNPWRPSATKSPRRTRSFHFNGRRRGETAAAGDESASCIRRFWVSPAAARCRRSARARPPPAR